VYGLTISIAILASVLCADKLAKRSGLDPEIIWQGAPIVILSGLLGARLYHVSANLPYYLGQPLRIFQFWNGGLGIIGALLAGGLACVLFLLYKKEPLLPWVDITAVSVPLAQALGRWGNFFNTELFGLPTNLPWSMYVPENRRPEYYITSTHFHPLFLYESLANLALFWFLYAQYKKSGRQQGYFLINYVRSYCIIRFFLEFLRIDPWSLGGVNVAQLVCVVAFCATLPFLKNTSSKIQKDNVILKT